MFVVVCCGCALWLCVVDVSSWLCVCDCVFVVVFVVMCLWLCAVVVCWVVCGGCATSLIQFQLISTSTLVQL